MNALAPLLIFVALACAVYALAAIAVAAAGGSKKR